MEKPTPVPGYEDYFAVTREGAVFSLRSKKWIKTLITKNGYEVFCTRLQGRKGKAIVLRVHRLVAMTFLPTPSKDKPYVNHKDGNKKNNVIDNLEWCSCSENVKHAFAMGLTKITRGPARFGSKLSIEQIQEIRENKHKETVRALGVRFGVHHSTICKYTASW